MNFNDVYQIKRYPGHYIQFREDDNYKSTYFRTSLCLSPDDTKNIDNWFDYYLELYNTYMDDKDRKPYQELLLNLFSGILPLPDKQIHKYLLGKLFKYYNISNTGYLRSLQITPLCVVLSDLISEYMVKKTDYTADEFTGLTAYLLDPEISPNGNLLENILKLDTDQKICRKATSRNRTKILINLLNIIAEKGFHHDIKAYKKVLNQIQEADKELIEYIYSYQVKNKQGCYIFLNIFYQLKLYPNPWKDFEMKREIIEWLDTSKGAEPKDKWIEKLNKIREKIGSDNLKLICDTIIENKELKNYYFSSGNWWQDEVFGRFLKGAEWML